MKFTTNCMGGHGVSRVRIIKRIIKSPNDSVIYQLHFDTNNEDEGGLIEGTLEEMQQLGALFAQFENPAEQPYYGRKTKFGAEKD